MGAQHSMQDDYGGDEGHPLLGAMRPHKGGPGAGRGTTDFLGRNVTRDSSGAQAEECDCCGLFASSTALPRKVPSTLNPKP